MSSSHQPPHLTTPKLTYLTEAEWKPYFDAVERGFQEESPQDAESDRLDKAVFDLDRVFGFKAGDRWVATCGAFNRDLVLPGGNSIAVGAVTIVTVAAPYRRRGLLSQMMTHQLTDMHKRGEVVAALWASESLIYGRFGYGGSAPRARLSGQTRSTAYLPSINLGDGSVDEVSAEVFVPAASAIHAKLLPRRPGALNRPKTVWDWTLYDPEHRRDGATALRHVLHYDKAGTPNGFATYRIKDDWSAGVPNSEVRVSEVDATTPAAYARIWRHLLDLDLVRQFRLINAPVDASLRFLLADQRAVKTEVTDALYTRVVDVPAALMARTYATEIDVVLEIDDAILPHNTGRWHLKGGPDGVTCKSARRKADLSMGILELGTVYLGGPSFADLHRAGRVVEHKKGAVRRASLAFSWHRAPFCPDGF